MMTMNLFSPTPQLELVAIGNDPEAARAVGVATRAGVYVDERPGAEGLLFRTMVRAVTDDLDALTPAAGVGLYVVLARTMKPRALDPSGAPTPRTGPVTINAMVHHPGLTHRQSDAHWRDLHGPLALRIHVGMADYVQLSAVATISGTPYDGFALLGFDSDDDFRNRFYATPEGRAEVFADVSKFSDMAHSPRRLVATQQPT